MKNIFVIKDFYKDFSLLRAEFENEFVDAKRTQPKRFVWDYWYDQDQYHLIRTPAFHYFSSRLYQDFHSYLVQWGRENLGCHDISPPWLSYYVDGCYQGLHSDVPHGPWAFVYSLTPNKREFRGGETMILKPEVLNFWPNYRSADSYDRENFVHLIPSRMNQLTVFDPRFPHGVTELKGTRDPLKSRLVIHGWFVNPRPYVVGGLSTAKVQKALQKALQELSRILGEISLLDGTLSLRLRVGQNGEVSDYRVLTNTLVSLNNSDNDIRYFEKEIKRIMSVTVFPKARKSSFVTVPLIFR